MKSPFLFGLLALLSTLMGCKEVVKSNKSTISTLAPPTTSSQPISALGIKGGSPFTHTQHIGNTKSDVYFIFTNPTGAKQTTPSFSPLGNQVPSTPAASTKSLANVAKHEGFGLRGTPEITEFNAHPPAFIAGAQKTFKATVQPRFSTVGDTYAFMALSTTEIVNSTLRSVITDGTVTANLWVADDSWGTCAKANCLTQAMVDAFGAKFLVTGASNDIYDWVTNIYGAPWGTHTISNLISPSALNTIDILFYDISADNSTNGGILGFFYSKDNYLTSSQSFSNQRLMFYMDSVLTATPTGTSWAISDLWPAEMVATLAHEFQHMIHFYQKTVLKQAGTTASNAWIHELMSMMTEDLVADKIQANGPRGVSYSDGTAGSTGNNLGRPALFNAYPYISQATWANDSYVLMRYAINYSFGAWLYRNYGGVLLAQQMMKSSTDDIAGMLEALKALGYTVTYDELLRNFWAAVVLSNRTDNKKPYQLNQGSYFTSTLNSINYNLGSLNFYNYGLGPTVYSNASLSSSLLNLLPYSGVVTLAGSNVSGTLSSTVSMPLGVNMTVVVTPH